MDTVYLGSEVFQRKRKKTAVVLVVTLDLSSIYNAFEPVPCDLNVCDSNACEIFSAQVFFRNLRLLRKLRITIKIQESVCYNKNSREVHVLRTHSMSWTKYFPRHTSITPKDTFFIINSMEIKIMFLFLGNF